MTVTLIPVKFGPLKTTLGVYGRAAAREDITVATDLPGHNIIGIYAEEGDYVKKDQVLARLDPSCLQHSFDSLKADLVKAENEFLRAYSLMKTGVIAKKRLVKKKPLI